MIQGEHKKLLRILGPHERVPTLADDSGILHALLYAVNAHYRGSTLQQRCQIVLRFRQKLAKLFERDYPEFPAGEHADSFAASLRAYSGRITPPALRLIEIVLEINIALLHLPRQKLIRRIDYTFGETVVLAWDGNWGVLRFASGSCVLDATAQAVHERHL